MSAAGIVVVRIGETDVVVPLIDIPDDAPAEIREGLALRNVVNTGGTCGCGARMVLPSRAERRRAVRAGRALDVMIEHAHNCPAGTARLSEAIARWRA